MASHSSRATRVLWMPLDYEWRRPSADARHCCETMAWSLEMTCSMHADPFECPDVPFVFHEIFGEYGIPVRDGGQSYILLAHCPWCAAPLPEGGRDRWFDLIEAEGLDDTPTDQLPERYRTAAWRIAAHP